MEKKQIHLIGNAHIDPIWLWRFSEGLAEIKATFKAAIDRINEYDSFIFTSASAAYYKWIEENSPELFEDIKKAVKAGKWSIVGGMWVQPDCNLPSGESFARHLLYSQRYFEEKFGITVKTGYNVDSFGHNAGLPKLLNEAGIENYVYMRPRKGEKDYGFDGHTFRWRCGDNEVVATTIDGYGGFDIGRLNHDVMKKNDDYVTEHNESIMKFYGCGNHGGGPTVSSIEEALRYMPEAENECMFSSPDKFYEHIRSTVFEELPVYEGEIQNIFSGCYSANSKIKALNRAAESRLNEAERMEVMGNKILGLKMEPEKNKDAWEYVLFNQFHDILAGCSSEVSYDDVYPFAGSSIAHGLKLKNAVAQRLSWAIDTAHGVPTLSKETSSMVWDNGVAGAPVVVFNPLSHEVTVPAQADRADASACRDSDGNFIPFQTVHSYWHDGKFVRFMAKVPAFGYKTFWVYKSEEVQHDIKNPFMKITEHSLSNDVIDVEFDTEKGFIKSVTDKKGNKLFGNFLSRAVIIDDSKNDTWGLDNYVFDDVIGEFDSPEFSIFENGPCQISLSVVSKYKNSTLEQVYTLYPGDPKIHVFGRLILNETHIQVKIAFDSGFKTAKFIREVPGGIVDCETFGREEPMQRFMIAEKDGVGVAVVNDSKYSSSIKDGAVAFIAARSCYYAAGGEPHEDKQTAYLDIGTTKFKYDIMAYNNNLSDVFRAAEEINTEFPVIPETYHYGPLPESDSNIKLENDNITVSALKPAEDGDGYIVRLSEIGGLEADISANILGVEIKAHVKPFDIQSYRLAEGKAIRVDITEKSK